jgi:hypothetical protein
MTTGLTLTILNRKRGSLDVPEESIPEQVQTEESRKLALLGTGEANPSDERLATEVLNDPHLTALILALRKSSVGAFQVAAADLRSLEAATYTAHDMMSRFNAAGLVIKVMSVTEYKAALERT